MSVDLTWANLGAVGGSGSTRASERRAKTIALKRVTARQLNPLRQPGAMKQLNYTHTAHYTTTKNENNVH